MLKTLVFVKRGKTGDPGKNLRSKVRTSGGSRGPYMTPGRENNIKKISRIICSSQDRDLRSKHIVILSLIMLIVTVNKRAFCFIFS